MRALITGATGFVGSNLTRRLLRLGWKVNVLIRDKNNLGRISDVNSLSVFEGDLADKKTLLAAARGVDVIFNCAAALPYHRLTGAEYRKINVEGLKNVLIATKASGARLVHVSTVGIYGPTTAIGADEKSSPNPQDIYARTKVKGEKLIKEYETKYRVKVVIIRPTIAYGPSDTRPGFLNVFKMIKKGLFLPVGNGKNYFHTVYVGNLVDALILAAKKKEALGEDFIIGDDPPSQMKEIYKLVYLLSGKKVPALHLPVSVANVIGKCFDLFSRVGLPSILGTQRVKFLTENKRYRIDKAKEVLGYKPKVSLKEGLKRTYGWYRRNGYF